MKIEILKENISEQTRFLRGNIESFINKLDKIGDGGNTVVSTWENKKSSSVCVKKIRELPILKGNDLEREFDVQNQLFNAGVKVPEPLLIFTFQELENEVKKMHKHKAGFIHRDLRAGNVMIDNNGKPYLIKKDYAMKTGYFLEDLKESLPILRETIKSRYWQMKGYFPTDQFGQRRT